MKSIVFLSVQTMKTISTTEAFARLSRNLTSALSRSLFTLSLILTLLFSFSVGETFAATWMEEPSIVINGETKTASSLTNDHWGTQTDLKISWVHWYGKRDNKDTDAMWAEGKFAYGVAGTTSASWTDVRLTSGSWYDDYKTYYVNQDINLQLCANRKPGDYEIYFYFAHRTGDNNYLYYSNSSTNYHVYWTIPDPTISFSSNHTPVKGQPVTLSTSVSNWAYGMTIKSVTYKHNGTAISTKTTGDLSSTSYTHTPTVAGTGKYTVEVVCTYGSAGDVTYTESINVTDSYTVTYGSHTNGSFTIAVPNVSASSSSKNAASGQRVDISATGNTGYEFSAWNVYNTSTPATKVSTNSSDATTYFTMPAYAVTVDATFVGKYYDVTLDPDNGSSTSAIYPQYASSMPSTLKGGGALSAPTYTGYTFGGYYDERAGAGTQYYTNTMSSANNWNKASNTTLYAKWTPNTYTITLNSNGGTGSTESVEIAYGQTPPNTDDLGNHYFSITNPTKPGYTFLGWFTAADGGREVIDENGCFLAPVDGYTSTTSPGNIWIHPYNVTLYAKWNPVVTPIVQYTDNGGEYTTGTTGGTLTINGSSSATGVESGETYTIVATPAAGYCLESLTVGATSLYSQPKSAARQTTAYSNSSQTTTAPVTITAKFAKLKTITLYIFKGSYGGWVLQKYTPQVGNTEVTITPTATLADASHSNWIEVTFTDVTRVTGLSIAREAGAHFQDATVTQSGYYDTDKSALTGFHGKENISYGNQIYMIGDAAITLNPVYVGFATGGTYAWSVTSQPTGGAYSLSSTSVATPTFSATIAGTYTLRVTRTDADGCSASTSFDVIVTARPTTASTAPTADECQVLSVYSQYYRSLQASFSDWGSGSTKTDRTIDHVNMWEVNVGTAWADGGFGIEWGGQTFDVSGYTGLHFDVWTPSATTLYVTPVNRNAAYNGNEPESRHSGVATTAATWTSVNIPISQFEGATNRNYQLKIEGNKGQMMYLTNIYYYTTSSCPAEPVPVIHSKGIGTAQAQGEWMYCDNNGTIAGSRTNNTVDYYIATLNNEIIYKVITTDGQTMWSDANPYLYVLSDVNGRITEFQGTRNAANTEATSEQSIPGSVDASEFDWNLCVPLVGGTHHWNGRALSEKRTYKRGYVNNPNSDVTAPTVTSAAIKAESVNDGDTTIVVTGAADNSGEYFYYFEDEETGVYHISLSNEYTFPVTTDGRILNIKCYAVDFNGNLSDAKTVTVEMPLDPDTNLALNKPIVAGAGTNIANINDGDRGSRNDGANTGEDYTNQWVYIDLEGYYTLSSIKIWFETACPSNYVLQACETLPTPVNDDTRWRTIATRTTAPTTTGNAVENANVYDVSGSVARYVRIKSYHNYNNNAYGFAIFEFEVYGSAVVPKDVTAPTVTTAEATAIVNGDDLQLTLTASDGSKVFRITDSNDNVYVKTADASNHVVMDNIDYTYCTTYTFSVQAMDAATNLSSAVECAGAIEPAADFDLIHVPEGGVTATVSGQAGDPWQAAYAIDGNDNTYWAGRNSSGETTGEQWININLGRVFGVSSVKVAWNDNHASNLYIEGSRDGSNYYILKHITTAPTNYSAANNAIVYETYSLESHIRVRHLRLRAVDLTGEMAIRDVQIFGSCNDDYNKPIITQADIYRIECSSSDAAIRISVSAFDETTTAGSITYKAVFTTGGLSDQTGLTPTDGIITVSGLTEGNTYALRIYAYDGTNYSENYKDIASFTPRVSLYYFTGDATGTTGAWEDALSPEESAAKRRFSATAHSGIYHFSISVLGNDQQYRLYNDVEGHLTYVNDNNHWSVAGNQIISGHNGESIDVYAKDKDHFVSNFDDLRVYGAAVYAAEENNAFRMTYADNKFTWEGRVQSGTNAFRIIVNNNGSGVTSNSRARIMDITNWNNSSGWTHAKLTFDPATWTCTWSESVRDYCQRTGTTGDGLTINSATVLGAGESYTQEAYMSGTDWNLAVMFSGATLVNAYLQVFTAATGTGFTEYGTAFTDCGNGLFTLSVPAGDRTGWFKGNGVMRYTIKLVLEGAANVRQTDVHYYDFTDSGECAPDFFDIYHHDDVAEAPEGARTSFAGGVIMQPIRYFRHYDNSDWTTVCVPFDVSKVTVYDTGAERDYSLYPRFNNGTEDVEGYYWLKTFSEALPITSFESAWEQLTVNTNESEPDVLTTLVKPAKNTPYIIAFPDDGSGYYTTNWVVFHGAAGQTIDSEFTGRSSIALTDGYDFSQVQLQGNNTMHQSSTLTNIYTIDEGDDYFTRKTVAVPAFEAYVIGTAQVQASYAAVRYRGGQSVPTGVDNLPSTGDMQGSIYTATGVRVASFDGRDAMEHCLNHLSTGVYVVYTQSQVNKIVIP